MKQFHIFAAVCVVSLLLLDVNQIAPLGNYKDILDPREDSQLL